jgi:hypothetical protein
MEAASTCKGTVRTSCLTFSGMAIPSRPDVLSARAGFDKTETGVKVRQIIKEKKSKQRQARDKIKKKLDYKLIRLKRKKSEI